MNTTELRRLAESFDRRARIKALLDTADELDRLQAIVDAQQSVIDYYEADSERSNYESDDIPQVLQNAERALKAARSKTDG